MGWNLTGLVARVGNAIGLRGRWSTPYSAAHASGRSQRGSRPSNDTVFVRAYARRLAASSGADAKALETARLALGEDGDVVRRAAASGAPVGAIAALSVAWEKLSDSAKDTIRHPAGTSIGRVRFGAVRAVQVDQTTCGAAAMAMMLMIGDPLVAAWLMTGRAFGDYLPVEAVGATALGPRPGTIEERWIALQRTLHCETTRRGLVLAPWPRRFGTPPWRVDDETRFAGLAFRGAILDDSDPGAVKAAVAHASAALRDGIPVPLVTGGDSDGGLDQVVPRHVVLMVGRTEHGFVVYEPSTGRVLPLDAARLGAAGDKEPAFGHWTRACWLILPKARRAE